MAPWGGDAAPRPRGAGAGAPHGEMIHLEQSETRARRCCFSLGLVREFHILEKLMKSEEQISQQSEFQISDAAKLLAGSGTAVGILQFMLRALHTASQLRTQVYQRPRGPLHGEEEEPSCTRQGKIRGSEWCSGRSPAPCSPRLELYNAGTWSRQPEHPDRFHWVYFL